MYVCIYIYTWFIATLASQEYESSPIKLVHLIVKLIELFRLKKKNSLPSPKTNSFSSMKLHFRKDLKWANWMYNCITLPLVKKPLIYLQAKATWSQDFKDCRGDMQCKLDRKKPYPKMQEWDVGRSIHPGFGMICWLSRLKKWSFPSDLLFFWFLGYGRPTTPDLNRTQSGTAFPRRVSTVVGIPLGKA